MTTASILIKEIDDFEKCLSNKEKLGNRRVRLELSNLKNLIRKFISNSDKRRKDDTARNNTRRNHYFGSN
jgi:hypothetical protein